MSRTSRRIAVVCGCLVTVTRHRCQFEAARARTGTSVPGASRRREAAARSGRDDHRVRLHDCETGVRDPGQRHRRAGLGGRARGASVARGSQWRSGGTAAFRGAWRRSTRARRRSRSLRCGAAGGLGRPRGADGRRRQQRDDSAAGRRDRARRRAADPAGLRDLRERLGSPVGAAGGAVRAGARSVRRRVGAQRRGDREPGLHADEEDARRRDGGHASGPMASGRASTTTSANSQGGREALTVAQRYPADYDGIIRRGADRRTSLR